MVRQCNHAVNVAATAEALISAPTAGVICTHFVATLYSTPKGNNSKAMVCRDGALSFHARR